MDAKTLTDQQLEHIVENARGFLDSGQAEYPEMVRRVLDQAEDERDRRLSPHVHEPVTQALAENGYRTYCRSCGITSTVRPTPRLAFNEYERKVERDGRQS